MGEKVRFLHRFCLKIGKPSGLPMGVYINNSQLMENGFSLFEGANVAKYLAGHLDGKIGIFSNTRGIVRVRADSDDLAAKLSETLQKIE